LSKPNAATPGAPNPAFSPNPETVLPHFRYNAPSRIGRIRDTIIYVAVNRGDEFMGLRNILSAAVVMASFAVPADAATYPTFVLDTGASSINVALDDPGCGWLSGVLSCAALSASFGTGATGFSWTPGSPTDGVYVSDFFNWNVSGLGFETFNVEVTLAFSAPGAETTTGTGSGGFMTYFGIASAGVLTWSGVDPITFDDGSTLDIAFDNILAFGYGSSISSGAYFVGNTIAEVASVPLPASIPLLGMGLVALGLIRRRKKAA
jgi:hypothetical protein